MNDHEDLNRPTSLAMSPVPCVYSALPSFGGLTACVSSVLGPYLSVKDVPELQGFALWGRGRFAKMFGTSQRDWAYSTTDEKRRKQLERSRERWAKRRVYLSDKHGGCR